MDFMTAIKTCLKKYATFSGRASRSEYWQWKAFFIVYALIVMSLCGSLAPQPASMGGSTPGSALFQIALIPGILAVLAAVPPGLAVAVRRLHDINRSGWFFATVFFAIPLIAAGLALLTLKSAATGGPAPHVPVSMPLATGLVFAFIVGFVVYTYSTCKKGDLGPNRYGADPLAGSPGHTARTGKDTAIAVIGTVAYLFVFLTVASYFSPPPGDIEGAAQEQGIVKPPASMSGPGRQ